MKTKKTVTKKSKTSTKKNTSKKSNTSIKKKTTKKSSKKRQNPKKKSKTEILEMRCTFEWDYLMKSLQKEEHNFSSKEKFYQHIDKLYSMEKINQNNILDSFNKLKQKK